MSYKVKVIGIWLALSIAIVLVFTVIALELQAPTLAPAVTPPAITAPASDPACQSADSGTNGIVAHHCP